MPTSGVTAWSLTAREVIVSALEELGIVDAEDGATSTEAEKCLLRLNALLKTLPGGAYTETLATVTVPADSASGTLAAGVRDVTAARVVTGTTERPLARFARDEYQSLIDKTQSGVPRCFYVSYQRDAAVIYLWPVPTAITTLRIDYLRKPDTVTDLTETVDVPEEYQAMLIANLAVNCAPLYGVQPLPELGMRAAMLKREMEDAERPESYTMGYGAWLY